MKKILTLLTLAIGLSAGAQDSTNKVSFKLGLNYNSNLNYLGRTDELQSQGFFPLAELWLSKDFYLNAAPIFINNQQQKMEYAGTVTTAGIQHVGEKWITHLYLLKPFYRSGTPVVQSALKAQGGLNLTRLTPVVNLTLGGDVKFTDGVDFGATAGLDHIIRIPGGNGTFILDPSVFAYAGTQRFSSSFIKNKPGGLLTPPSSQTVEQENTRFNILAYEASLPLIYVQGKWMLSVTPSYIVPQNLVTVPNKPELSEKGEPTFYATAGIKYSF